MREEGDRTEWSRARETSVQQWLAMIISFSYWNNPAEQRWLYWNIPNKYLNVARIWLLSFVPPLYLQTSERSRRSYSRKRESFVVTKIWKKHPHLSFSSAWINSGGIWSNHLLLPSHNRSLLSNQKVMRPRFQTLYVMNCEHMQQIKIIKPRKTMIGKRVCNKISTTNSKADDYCSHVTLEPQ